MIGLNIATHGYAGSITGLGVVTHGYVTVTRIMLEIVIDNFKAVIEFLNSDKTISLLNKNKTISLLNKNKIIKFVG